MNVPVLAVVLIALAVPGAWCVAAVLVALLAGGVIHARDHRDVPYDRLSLPRPAARVR